MPDINDLRRARSTAAQKMEDCANAIGALESADDAPEEQAMSDALAAFEAAEKDFASADQAVKRAEAVENAKASAALGDADTGAPAGGAPAPAQPKAEGEKGIEAGFMFQALAACRGDRDKAVDFLEAGGHSGIAAAMTGATESAGGVTIPRAQSTEIIEMLRPRVAVRASGARVLDMPAGELRNARQNSSASASYEGENAPIPVSQPGFDKVDQKFKKLTSLVPVGNSLLRHSTAALAALVRDDVLNVMAAKEDLMFMRGDGTGNLPKGLKNWILSGNWQNAVEKVPLVVDAAIRAMVSRVEDTDVLMIKCGWIMRAATKNFLASLKDPNGNGKLFPSIEQNGTLLGYPIKTTSQLPSNLGVDGDEVEVFFGDFNELFIGDAMSIEFATSSEATYVDALGNVHSAFQEDKTLFRAISEHDIALMQDPAFQALTGKGWML